MSWFKDLISGGTSEVIEQTGKAIDELHTSHEEKVALKSKIQQSIFGFTGKMVDSLSRLEGEVSKRHAADMVSNSWLAKNVRPLSFLFTFGAVFYLLLRNADYHSQLVELLTGILQTMVQFYFVSRGIEKGIALLKGASAVDQVVTKGVEKTSWFKRAFGKKSDG